MEEENQLKVQKFLLHLGILDAGVECPHDVDKIPDENRIMGHHLDQKIETQIDDIKNKIIGDK